MGLQAKRVVGFSSRRKTHYQGHKRLDPSLKSTMAEIAFLKSNKRREPLLGPEF